MQISNAYPTHYGQKCTDFGLKNISSNQIQYFYFYIVIRRNVLLHVSQVLESITQFRLDRK